MKKEEKNERGEIMKKLSKEAEKFKKELLQEFESILNELPQKIIEALHEEIEIAQNEIPKQATIHITPPDDSENVLREPSLFDRLFGDVNFPHDCMIGIRSTLAIITPFSVYNDEL